jgi:hypothetical protein
LDLYVAAVPVLPENQMRNHAIRKSFIRFAERKLILDFVMKRKKMPRYNANYPILNFRIIHKN